jgi:hypothetical protein
MGLGAPLIPESVRRAELTYLYDVIHVYLEPSIILAEMRRRQQGGMRVCRAALKMKQAERGIEGCRTRLSATGTRGEAGFGAVRPLPSAGSCVNVSPIDGAG